VLNVSVEPSIHGADMVFVGINAHHPIVGPDFRQFDLGLLLRDSMNKDFRAKLIGIFTGNGKK
jgi:hypothetical protein